MSNWRHRPDGNTDEIVSTLEKLGMSVHRLNDVVDILIGYGGYTRLGEVRLPGSKPIPRPGRQAKFHERWTGGVYWLQTLDDCVACAKSMKLHAHMIQDGYQRLSRGGLTR